uniref:GAG-pre-integrase domain-containing protein n=1 Tax=Solanum lycopersicum TaxID=4081 RepID=A0A3Q7HCI7_SOLLC
MTTSEDLELAGRLIVGAALENKLMCTKIRIIDSEIAEGTTLFSGKSNSSVRTNYQGNNSSYKGRSRRSDPYCDHCHLTDNDTSKGNHNPSDIGNQFGGQSANFAGSSHMSKGSTDAFGAIPQFTEQQYKQILTMLDSEKSEADHVALTTCMIPHTTITSDCVKWIVDSGASSHIVSSVELLSHTTTVNKNGLGKVHLPTGNVVNVIHTGSSCLFPGHKKAFTANVAAAATNACSSSLGVSSTDCDSCSMSMNLWHKRLGHTSSEDDLQSSYIENNAQSSFNVPAPSSSAYVPSMDVPSMGDASASESSALQSPAVPVTRKSSRTTKPPIWMHDYVSTSKGSANCCYLVSDVVSSDHLSPVELGLSDTKPVYTPLETNLKLTSVDYDDFITKEAGSTNEDILLVDPTQYQRLVGKLLYLTMTRVDIAYVVKVLSQFMHSPKQSHMNAALRVVKYIKNAPGLGLLVPSDSSGKLVAYCDSDWGGCLQN